MGSSRTEGTEQQRARGFSRELMEVANDEAALCGSQNLVDQHKPVLMPVFQGMFLYILGVKKTSVSERREEAVARPWGRRPVLVQKLSTL